MHASFSKRNQLKNPNMMRPSTVLLLLLLSLLDPRLDDDNNSRSAVSGYRHAMITVVSPPPQQRSSTFVGRDVLASSSSSSTSTSWGQNRHRSGTTIEMKKGKANLPSHMRSQYKRSQEMEAYRQQMMESQVRYIY